MELFKKKSQNKPSSNNNNKDIFNSKISNNLKSIEKSRLFLKFLVEIIKEFVKLSEKYSINLENIASKLTSDEIAKKKIEFSGEIPLLEYIKKTISLISERINKMSKNINDHILVMEAEKISKIDINIKNKKNENADLYEKYEAFSDICHNKYFKKISELEDYLGQKYLNEKENNNKSNFKNDKKFKSLNENLLEAQKGLLKHLNSSNENITKLLKDSFTEDYLNHQKIYDYTINFLENVNEALYEEKNNDNIDIKAFVTNIEKEKASTKTAEQNFEKEECSKLLLKLKYYSLKCLTNENEDKSTDEFTGLNYEKILYIFEEIKNKELLISDEDKNKIEKIKNIIYIQKNIDILFDDKNVINLQNDNKIKEDTNSIKTKIEDLFKSDKIYMTAFIQYLNNKRVEGNLKISKNSIEMLGSWFNTLNNYLIENKDYFLFKILILLSMTYYFNDKNDEKIFLSKYIINCAEFTKEQFWIDYLKDIINNDLKGNEELKKPIIEYSYKDIKNLNSKKIHVCIYSNIFSVIKMMIDLKVRKDFIIEWLNIVKNNIFFITEEEKNEIINLINSEDN